MNADWLLENLLAWSAQVCVLTAVAAGAALALKTPRARLWFWQAMLGSALLLPFIQPWVAPRGPAGNITIFSGPGVPGGDSPAYSGLIFRREYVLALIAAGTALRLLWIAIGFLRLRRHRLAARVLPDPPFASARVRWYLSDTVSGPVTFGWLRPSILLPSRVNGLGEGLREAIACHELIHVERRDWLFVVLEELIRSALWFHPAIWFLLGQIQLSREQTVDGEVVRRTGDRGKYLDALVAVAEQKFSPAPLFLKKRQLARRVAAVLKETQVSRSSVAARFATVFSAALVAARLAMWFFPMQAPAQTASEAVPGDDPAMTVDAGAPLIHRPPIFRGYGVSAAGTIVVDAVLNDKGEVSDARVVSGPDELRRPVLESVLQWHYSSEPRPPASVRITVTFEPRAAEKLAAEVPRSWQQDQATLKVIHFASVPPDLQRRVRDALPVHEGDKVSAASMIAVLEAARRVDEHFVGNLFVADGNAELNLSLGAPLPTPPPAAELSPQRIRVGGSVQATNLLKKVVPAYPADAKAARVQGQVKFTATIGKDGTIVDLQLISGDPLLAPAASDAVKQWVYKPTLLNGQPLEVITEIDVNFTLSQ